VIVYGDTSHRETFGENLSRLRSRVQRAQRSPRPSLDELRTVLILCGQLEQAALDAIEGGAPSHAAVRTEPLHAATLRAAGAFLGAWLVENEPRAAVLDAHAGLAAVAHALETASRSGADALMHVRAPEGFAQYALYPEQYIEAALQWSADHRDEPERLVLVVGVRSIGTTLGAVVASVLALHGFDARAIAIRPSGHPFARRAQLDAASVGAARAAIVVDEGPGLSGSSMASVADALVRAGIGARCISFMPGHAGGPGQAASEAVLRWWAEARTYAPPLESVRLCGRPVSATLAALLPELYGPAAEVERIEDVSAGAWRALVYADRAEWPALCTNFERQKLRFTTRGGARYLFKFAGLGCAGGADVALAEAQAAALKQRADLGLSQKPVIVAHGFIATRWVEGRPLTERDADVGVLHALGRYLARSTGTRLSAEEQADALARLENMVSTNVHEALGEAAASRLRQVFLSGVREAAGRAPRAYGDGHLAPHEWLRIQGGELCKVDCVGHDTDHTIVGRQSVAWDIAGAACEWKLGVPALEVLLDAYRAAGGEYVPLSVISAYRLAYAAFRAGQCHLSATLGAVDAHDRAGLHRAFSAYCTELCRAL
jgi:hypothetical protein